MYKDLLENGIKAGLHWGSARNKVNPETYGYLLGYRQQKDQKKVSLGLNADAGTYSVIDLDLSFQALRRAIQYIQKARQADGQIVCVIDNSLPATLSQQLAYFALNNNLVVKTGKEAQAMLKVHARKRLAVLSQRGRRAHNRAQQLKAGGTYLKPSVANTFSSSQSALVAATETTRKQVAGLFMIGGLNSGRAMTIIAARKACVPVVSLCDPSACLDGITYPVIVNTTSSAAVYYILEVITYALLNTAPSTTLHNKV
jgi:hypothetical protein